MTTIFNFYALPVDESDPDALRTATSFNAANARQARAAGVMRFLEEYTDADDQDFQFFVCEDQPGIPRGELDVWDESLFIDNDWDPEAGHLVARSTPEFVDFDKLSATMKVAVLVKYMTTEITKDQLPAALDLLQDEASTFPGHIVEAVGKMPAIVAMYPERIMEAITYVVEKCPTNKKWPEIKAQLANWLKEHEKERKEGACDAPSNEEIPAATTAGYTGRSYEHTYRTLNKEIAYALWSGDIDPAKTEASISRWADDIIKQDREDWKRWSACIVTRDKILTYDRPTIFGLIRNAPKPDIYKFPGELNAYITDYLTNHGVTEGVVHEKAEHEPQEAPGALEDAQATSGSVDTEHSDSEPQEAPKEDVITRQGPFYYRTPKGEVGRANKLPKLEAVIAEGCVEITREEYTELKNQPSRQDVDRMQSAQRGEFVEGVSDPRDPESVSVNAPAQPKVENLGGGHFSIDGLVNADPTASNVVEKMENLPCARQPGGDFQSVGASLEKSLQQKPAEAQDNLRLWRSVMRTDPRFTKDITGTGFDGTSVNAEYMIMRATELFGPLGSGWGYEIQEEKLIPGAPMSEPVYNDKNIVGHRFLRDADGTLITEQHHSIRIRLWYETQEHDGSVIAYGATPYIYKTKHGLKCDGEAPKKSLTDAIKKALSMLGFSADVWLGMYDRPEYVAEVGVEFGIKTASEKAEDTTRLRAELDEKLTRVANTIEQAVNTNEAKKVYDTLAREVEVHRKAAEAKGDTEHARYLSGRIRRLSQIKDERIKALTDNQEQSA